MFQGFKININMMSKFRDFNIECPNLHGSNLPLDGKERVREQGDEYQYNITRFQVSSKYRLNNLVHIHLESLDEVLNQCYLLKNVFSTTNYSQTLNDLMI